MGASAVVVSPETRIGGLLPGVEPHDPAAKPGDGDTRVQAVPYHALAAPPAADGQVLSLAKEVE